MSADAWFSVLHVGNDLQSEECQREKSNDKNNIFLLFILLYFENVCLCIEMSMPGAKHNYCNHKHYHTITQIIITAVPLSSHMHQYGI